MDDPLLVRGLERFGDLLGDRKRLTDGDRRARDPIGERRALDQFHDQGSYAAGVFEAMDLRDMRMIERGEHLRFTTEAGEAIGIVGDAWQQNLDRDLAIQLRVAGSVDFAHPARADPRVDLVRADALALETLRGDGVFDLNRSGRLEEALGALVRRQERFHLLAQGLVAFAGFGQVRRASFRRQRPRAREHVF